MCFLLILTVDELETVDEFSDFYIADKIDTVMNQEC